MNRHMLWASLISLALASPSFADNLNPQPEPPGRSKILHNNNTGVQSTIGSATGGAGSGKLNTVGSATGGAGSGRSAMRKAGGTQMNSTFNGGVTHGFNPQPDPPGTPPTNTQGQH